MTTKPQDQKSTDTVPRKRPSTPQNASPLVALARTKVIPDAISRELASMWEAKESLSRETAFLETATRVVNALSEPEVRKLLAQTLSWIAQEELKAAEKRQKKALRKKDAETDTTN